MFLVKRRSDNKKFALKFCEPKKEEDRAMIEFEIGIMQYFNEKYACDAIINCHEAFNYVNRLWIFLEHMDGGSLTRICEDC